MTRPSQKQILKVLAILASAGFSLFINSYWQQINNLDVLIKHSSLNTWNFYNFNNVFFLDFNFYHLHPYYLIATILAKFFSLKIVLILFLIALAVLFLALFRIEKFTFNDFILWTVSLPFLFVGNATLLMLWIQYLSFRIFQNYTSSWDASRLLIGRTIFYSSLSLIFLPGLVLIYCLDFLEHFFRHHEWNPVKNVIYSLSFVLPVLLVFHLLLGLFLFDVPWDNLGQYLYLPVNAYLTKFRVNNLVLWEVFFTHIETHKNMYMGLPYLYFLSVINDDRGVMLIKTAVIFILLLAGIYVSQGTPLFYVFCAYFVFLTGPRPINATLQIKTLILMGAVVLIFFHVMTLPVRSQRNIEIKDPNIIISFIDFNRADFSANDIRSIAIVDLKIIPANVEQLLADTRSGKIEPFLNAYFMTFLDRELKYGASILENLENKRYSIYIKSAIHPETENPPFRRVYEVWNKLKDTGSKIILF